MITKVNTLARHTESIQMDAKMYTEIKEGARSHHDMLMTFGSLADRPHCHTVRDNESTRLTRIETEHASRDASVAARLVTPYKIVSTTVPSAATGAIETATSSKHATSSQVCRGQTGRNRKVTPFKDT